MGMAASIVCPTLPAIPISTSRTVRTARLPISPADSIAPSMPRLPTCAALPPDSCAASTAASIACRATAPTSAPSEAATRISERSISNEAASTSPPLRPPGPLVELGNRFGLVFLDLPVDVDDPVARVLEVHRRMDALKQSRQPVVALGILTAMGMAPQPVRERLLDVLAANASLVLTNVHGQDQARYLAGKHVAQQMFWVPQAGGIGVGASILSYNGQVSFGLVTDALRVPDPAALALRFAAEFERLVLAALLMPWPAKP